MPTNETPVLAGRALTAVPDTLDFRDQLFVPTLIEVLEERPLEVYLERMGSGLEILDQGTEGACTGFALAAMANYLLWTRAHRRRDGAPPVPDRVSPWMLYTMAKRYDEWPGEDYDGSSARGAMKAWHKHGVCGVDFWCAGAGNGDGSASARGPGSGHADAAGAHNRAGKGNASATRAGTPTGNGSRQDPALWARRWEDARSRPLGAYFRVNHKDLVAMHAALEEVGILYATGLVHDGWSPDKVRGGEIPFEDGQTGGHAFVIVGYDGDGFWIQNSWGRDWGYRGFAKLSYDDWLQNGMDAWVARMGAPVRVGSMESTATGISASSGGTRGYVFTDLRSHIISIGNDGRPRTTGTYGTDADAIEEIFAREVPAFMAKREGPVHLLLYAHGGLVGEDTAIQRVADYRAALMERGVYPVSFSWKSDFWTTLKNILRDAMQSRRQEGVLDSAKDFMLDRLDDAIEPLARGLGGKAQWDEMKENALLATTSEWGGARIAARAIEKHLGRELAVGGSEGRRLFLHIVGHSAGSIVMAPLARLLASSGPVGFGDLHTHPAQREAEGLGLPIDSCTLWAPACTVGLFNSAYRPLLESRAIGRFNLFTLTDDAERDDHCARVYNKSLLYLVSNAFEARPRIPLIRDTGVPILGMARAVQRELADFFAGRAGEWVLAPNDHPAGADDASSSRSHGAFDDDDATLQSTLARILACGASQEVSLQPAAFRFGRSAEGKRDLRRSITAQQSGSS